MNENGSLLFGDNRVAKVSTGASQFRHLFGGKSIMSNERRIHRLYQIDCSDPAVPVLTDSETLLDLYYCFDFRENSVGYFPGKHNQLFFDQDDPFKSEDESYPYENFPDEFPGVSVRVDPVPYDPTRIEDALAFGGVFGINHLSPKDYQRALAHQREFYEMVMEDPNASDADVLDFLCAPLAQECPSLYCINPQCSSYRSKKAVVPFCVVSNCPIEDLDLFGQYSEVQVIFEVCRNCGLILASNQAT